MCRHCRDRAVETPDARAAKEIGRLSTDDGQSRSTPSRIHDEVMMSSSTTLSVGKGVGRSANLLEN
jgi:hypothetical protein